MPSDTDIAWLAGLLEGEGTFAAEFGGGRTAGSRPYLRIKLDMTDRDVVERAASLMGTDVKVATREARGTNYRQQYSAVVRCAEAETTMKMVLPYMGERRSAKIRAILAMDLSHHPRMKAAA